MCGEHNGMIYEEKQDILVTVRPDEGSEMAIAEYKIRRFDYLAVFQRSNQKYDSRPTLGQHWPASVHDGPASIDDVRGVMTTLCQRHRKPSVWQPAISHRRSVCKNGNVSSR